MDAWLTSSSTPTSSSITSEEPRNSFPAGTGCITPSSLAPNSWNAATDAVNTLLAPFREIVIDRNVAERAGRVRRESGTRLPDALIAATALEHSLGLVTRNHSDFDNIRQLRLKNLA